MKWPSSCPSIATPMCLFPPRRCCDTANSRKFTIRSSPIRRVRPLPLPSLLWAWCWPLCPFWAVWYVIRDFRPCCILTCPVALPGRQPQPPPYRAEVCPCPSRCFRRIPRLDRGVLLPILCVLEPFPASSCGRGGGCDRIHQRQPCTGRSAGSTVCRA